MRGFPPSSRGGGKGVSRAPSPRRRHSPSDNFSEFILPSSSSNAPAQPSSNTWSARELNNNTDPWSSTSEGGGAAASDEHFFVGGSPARFGKEPSSSSSSNQYLRSRGATPPSPEERRTTMRSNSPHLKNPQQQHQQQQRGRGTASPSWSMQMQVPSGRSNSRTRSSPVYRNKSPSNPQYIEEPERGVGFVKFNQPRWASVVRSGDSQLQDDDGWNTDSNWFGSSTSFENNNTSAATAAAVATVGYTAVATAGSAGAATNAAQQQQQQQQQQQPPLGTVTHPIQVDSDLEARERDVLKQASRKKKDNQESFRDQDVLAARVRSFTSRNSTTPKQSQSDHIALNSSKSQDSSTGGNKDSNNNKRGLFRLFGGLGRKEQQTPKKTSSKGASFDHSSSDPADSEQVVTSLSMRHPSPLKQPTHPSVIDTDMTTSARAQHISGRTRPEAPVLPESSSNRGKEKRFTFKSANDHQNIVQRVSDESTVSEVTNPTFFQKDGVPRTIISSPRTKTPPPPRPQQLQLMQQQPIVVPDPFDIHSPVFASDPFSPLSAEAQQKPRHASPLSPRRSVASPVGSDDFSDPFFPPAAATIAGSGRGATGADNRQHPILVIDTNTSKEQQLTQQPTSSYREEKKENDWSSSKPAVGKYRHAKARIASPSPSRSRPPAQQHIPTSTSTNEITPGKGITPHPSSLTTSAVGGKSTSVDGDGVAEQNQQQQELKKLELPIGAKASFSTTGAVAGFLPLASARSSSTLKQKSSEAAASSGSKEETMMILIEERDEHEEVPPPLPPPPPPLLPSGTPPPPIHLARRSKSKLQQQLLQQPASSALTGAASTPSPDPKPPLAIAAPSRSPPPLTNSLVDNNAAVVVVAAAADVQVHQQKEPGANYNERINRFKGGPGRVSPSPFVPPGARDLSESSSNNNNNSLARTIGVITNTSGQNGIIGKESPVAATLNEQHQPKGPSSAVPFLTTEAPLAEKGMVPTFFGAVISKRRMPSKNSSVLAVLDKSLMQDSAVVARNQPAYAVHPYRVDSSATEPMSAPAQQPSHGTETMSVSAGMTKKLRRRQERKSLSLSKATLIRESVEKQEASSKVQPEGRRLRKDQRLSSVSNRERLAILRARSPFPEITSDDGQKKSEAALPVASSSSSSSSRNETRFPDTNFVQPNRSNSSKENAPEPEASSKYTSFTSRKQLVGHNSTLREQYPVPESQRLKKGQSQQLYSQPLRNRTAALRRKKEVHEFSDDDTCDTCSLASARSDIRRLRTYIRRSMKNKQNSPGRGLGVYVSELTVYDESKVKDPMQRAGLRLLSAAVIPIQAAARRHLALRTALTRMWAIVILQSLARRWIAWTKYKKMRVASIMLQAWFRGCVVRDEALLKECCAIEIQRIVRGHLATIRVYEDIFRITIVQSIVRRKLAIDYATDRMILVLQLQGLIRGYLWRKRLRRLNEAALKIQTKWRAFICQFSYQLDLLDIIIVQSIWRRNRDVRIFEGVKWLRRNDCASLIQAHWRGFSARMRFCDILAALVIQTRWRTYVCSTWYAQYIAARKIQTSYRRYICSSWFKQYKAARRIQTCFRTYVYSTWYKQYMAATAIQTCFRMYVYSTWYRQYVASRKIQACFRTYVYSTWYRQYRAASKIQAYFRMHICSTWYRQYSAASKIQAYFRMHICSTWYRRYRAATKIQALRRAQVCKRNYVACRSAIKIQAIWRSYFCSKRYLDYVAAMMIQSHMRRYICEKACCAFKAARKIQARVRGFLMSSKYKMFLQNLKVFVSATKIQAQWRCFICSREYLRTIAVIMMQAAWRRFNCQRKYRAVKAAIKIQAAWRSYVCSRNYLQIVAAIMLQAKWRAFVCEKRYKLFVSARKIQAQWRCFVCSKAYIQVVAAIMIQTRWRLFVAAREYRRIRAAIKVQSHWRSFVCSKQYLLILAAAIIQTRWRAHRCRRAYVQYKAALRIQCHWRAYACTLRFLQHIADVLIVQSAARRWLARRKVSRMKHSCALVIQTAARAHQARLLLSELRDRKAAATTIQRVWRGFVVYANYMFTVADIVVIQSLIRRLLARKLCRKIATIRMNHAIRVVQRYSRVRHMKKTKAAIAVQCFWRSVVCQTDYLIAKYEKAAAVTIQSYWRRFWLHSHFVILVDSAIQIQTAFRALVARVAYSKQRAAATVIQCAFRGFSARIFFRGQMIILSAFYAGIPIELEEGRSAALIQASVRGYLTRSSVTLYRSARTIQTAFRAYRDRTAYIQFLSSRKIQSSWRAWRVRISYVQFLSARKIQTAWRAWRDRVTYILFLAARKIQTSWRAWRDRVVYTQFMSARKIQTSWRACSARWFYVDYTAARRIQASWRAHSDRRNFALFKAARKIQTCWRASSARWLYVVYRAAKRIQASWRAHRDRRTYVQFMAARKIQTKWRACTVRWFYVQFTAARKIQTKWRACSARWFYVQFMAARKIQTKWRACSARWFYVDYTAARRIQASWRAYCLRDVFVKFVAARKIQSKWRACCARWFYVDYTSARRIQALWRAYRVRDSFVQFVAARRIQASWRASCARWICVELLAARRIQALWRGCIIRWAYREYIGARLIQSAWRCYITRSFYREFIAARRIQNSWRCSAARRYSDEMRCARKIQCSWRCFVTRRAYVQYTAVRKVQALWRCYFTRLAFVEYKGARLIQTAWRCYRSRLAFLEYRAARLIQAAWRGCSARLCVFEFLSARKIQSFWRCQRVHRVYRRYRSAVRIQSWWRQKRDRQAFVAMREIIMADTIAAAVVAQKIWRGLSIRMKGLSFIIWQRRLYVEDPAATAIQKTWRGYVVIQSYWHTLGSAIQIQSLIRGWRARAHYRVMLATGRIQAVARRWIATRKCNADRKKKILTQSAIKLQALHRGNAARKFTFIARSVVKIQSLARRFLARCEVAELLGAIIFLQCTARGFLARRQTAELRLQAAAVTSSLSSAVVEDLDYQERVDLAARKIQRFFLMIKREVDKEVQAAKKRRRAKKKTRKTFSPDADDEMLENIWRSTIDTREDAPEAIRRAQEGVARELRTGRRRQGRIAMKDSNGMERYRPSTHRSGRLHRTASQRSVSRERRQEVKVDDDGAKSNSMTPGEMMLSMMTPSWVRNAAASYHFRIPPSRMATFSRDEIDQDLCLEEAWIDAEINHAKERRQKKGNNNSRRRQPQQQRTMEV